ncbi:MAG: immune inhibitor A [Chloroflexi bacterium]|nr:immune inhibitor A [Chloroflexota bacterium]
MLSLSIKRCFLGVVLLVFLAVACVSPYPRVTPTPTSTPILTPTPTSTLVPTLTPTPTVEAKPPSPTFSPPPDADLYELVRRIRLKSRDPIQRATGDVAYEVGQRHTFWAVDLDERRPFPVEATLRYISPHAYFWFDEGLKITQEELERSARELEERIIPSDLSLTGVEWPSGIRGSLRITLLHGNIPNVAGYYSSADEYPSAVNPYSNERKMFYINMGVLRPASPTYYAVLAHELQHALHWMADPTEEEWISEGLSVLAEEVAGYPQRVLNFFLRSPDTQLNAWAEDPQASAPHYGAAYLFMKYLSQVYGTATLKELVSEPADGIEGVDSYIRKKDIGASFEDVFRDWVIANYLDSPEGVKYGYPRLDVRINPTEVLSNFRSYSGAVHQYAANYIELRLKGGDALLSFQGSTLVKLIPNEPHSGKGQWWSNRGSVIDSTMTREFDLSGLTKATLNFWTWYDIEKDFDYAYVEVSTDGGVTWQALQGRYSTPESPVGNSLGYAYTGKSGEGSLQWVEENIDLTPFTGGKVLLRFEYVTDDAVSNAGLALDDISIPELGYLDDAERDNGWKAEGFIRTENLVPQRFIVQVIEYGKEVRVREMPLDDSQRGELVIKGFGSELSRAVLVIAALAPLTTEKATYEFTLSPYP